MGPPLLNLLGICVPIVGLIGALLGLAFPPQASGGLLKNFIDGAQVGAVCGTAVALTIWVVLQIARI